ncbi:hypothetical protein GC175_21730 [bacterium]|nr:hypothetical protein [bacterium]
MDTLSSEFLVGFGIGLVVTLFVGFIWRVYQNWVKRAQALDKPQMIPQFTKLTPNDVYQDAMRARLTMFIFWVILVFIGLMLWAWIDPRVWNFILSQISMLV